MRGGPPSSRDRRPPNLVWVAVGVLAVVVITAWHRVLPSASSPRRGGGATDARIVEHERPWRRYLRGFDVHHSDDAPDGVDPAAGSLRHGLARWGRSGFLRGYTIGNHVYVCPGTPRTVRVHQAGHTPAFGEVFDPLDAPRRPDGGLPDEPLRSLDVMLPGGFPHTLLRVTDRRGLGGAYRAWRHDGRIRRTDG